MRDISIFFVLGNSFFYKRPTKNTKKNPAVEPHISEEEMLEEVDEEPDIIVHEKSAVVVAPLAAHEKSELDETIDLTQAEKADDSDEDLVAAEKIADRLKEGGAEILEGIETAVRSTSTAVVVIISSSVGVIIIAIVVMAVYIKKRRAQQYVL